MRALGLLVAVAVASCRPSPLMHPAPSRSNLIERSHAILGALDRGDVPVIQASLGRGYVHFENGAIDRDGELEASRTRASKPPRIESRVWSNESVSVGETSATFIGQAREQNAGNKLHGGGYIYEGWYTLGWAREGNVWKLMYLGWQPAGNQTASASWNQIYEHSVGFNHEPNRLLVKAVGGVRPGNALDIATGQGRNAIYLATAGWNVTGIDIAEEGLRQARERAAKDKLPLTMINADVDSFDVGTDRWDLIALIYAPAAWKRISDIKRAIRPGGLLVYEYFASEDPDDEPAPGELAKQFKDWEIVTNEVVDGVPDWGQDHAKLERFVARKK
jgi:SAM-dependent methyltransferase